MRRVLLPAQAGVRAAPLLHWAAEQRSSWMRLPAAHRPMLPGSPCSIRLSNADLPHIREILRGVSDAQYRRLLEAQARYRDAYCWQRSAGCRCVGGGREGTGGVLGLPGCWPTALPAICHAPQSVRLHDSGVAAAAHESEGAVFLRLQLRPCSGPSSKLCLYCSRYTLIPTPPC